MFGVAPASEKSLLKYWHLPGIATAVATLDYGRMKWGTAYLLEISVSGCVTPNLVYQQEQLWLPNCRQIWIEYFHFRGSTDH